MNEIIIKSDEYNRLLTIARTHNNVMNRLNGQLIIPPELMKGWCDKLPEQSTIRKEMESVLELVKNV